MEKKSIKFFLPFSKLLIRIYVTSERMVGISSVLPFWNPQNVSSNLGYSKTIFQNFWEILFFSGGKKYFFNLDDVEPLIFWSLVFEFINHFLVKRREKNALGVNFFHFLRVHFSTVQNLAFGTGVRTHLALLVISLYCVRS